jgi:RHS repeat-associated protein/uncharacterized repeat protein (TIGR01451 family)
VGALVVLGLATGAAADEADLAIQIELPLTVPLGQLTRIELRALNAGPSATPAAVAMGVPSGVNIVGVAPGGCGLSAGFVTCSTSLAPTQTFLVSIDAVFVVPGTRILQASISGPLPDPNPGNNVASRTVAVVPPGTARLSVLKEDGPDPVVRGNRLAYGIAVTNTGTATARGVVLTDTLPLEVRVASLAPEDRCGVTAEQDVDGDGLADRQIVSCQLGDLDPGQTALVEIVVDTGLRTGQLLINEAEATSPDAAPAADATTTSVVSASANFDGAGFLGDPVSTLTRELFAFEAVDLHLGGVPPVVFGRYYSSGLRRDGRIAGRLGHNWLHTYEALLRRQGDTVEVVTNQGRVVQFQKSGDAWTQFGQVAAPFQLVESGAGFVLGDPRTDLLMTFDPAGRPTRIEDDAGNAHTLVYAGDRLAQVSDGRGRTLSFAYDGLGRLSAVSDGVRTVAFGHTGNNLTSVTDPLGHVTTYRYDPADLEAGRLVATTRPRGNTPYTQTYDSAGRVIGQTDAAGNTVTLGDGAPGETVITDPLGRTQRHAHSDQGELVTVTDELGQTVVLGYDDAGRRVSASDRLGGATAYSYHPPSGKLAAITHADDTATTLTYTARDVGGVTLFDVTTVRFPDGATRSLAYDAAGNIVRITDEAGQAWSYTYNDRGQPLTATNPAGGTAALTYHPDATLATLTTPDGHTTAFAYDALKRLTRMTRPDGTAQTYSYDARDLLLTITNERGHTATFTYDANGKLASATDPLGHTTTFAYDGLDRPISRTDPLGHAARVGYDERGRVQALTDRNGHTLTVAYDARGHLAAVTDPSGQVWAASHDAEGLLVSTTDPLSHTRRFESDTLGRLTRITSPLGEASRFTYDARRRVTHLEDPLGGVVAQQYDVRGLLAGRTLPGGAIAAAYARDALGSMVQVTDPNGQVWQRPADVLGRPAAAIDPLGRTMSFEYDTRGRVSGIGLPDGMGSVELAYDGSGNLVRRRHSDGTELRYVYDAADRLVAADGLTLAHDGNGVIVESNGIAIGRDPEGRITGLTLAPGKVVTYAYDARDRLTRVTDWLGGAHTFDYDAAGRLTAVTRPNGVPTTYAYDANNRLVGVAEGALASLALTRDGRGEVVAADRRGPLAPSAPTASAAFAYDAASQLEALAHDGLGRLLQDGRRAYTWDLASRLVRYTEGGQAVDSTYDAAGQRLTRSAGGVTRGYVWNYGLDLPSVGVERQGGIDRRYYVHTPGGLLLYSVEAGDGSRRFYHYDHAGSTAFLTDDLGQVRTSYAYSPYGVLLASQGDDGENPFTYLGSYGVMREGASGLYYMRARYYDSDSGRFITRDPVQWIDPRAINPYQYAFANPVRFVDPLGLCPNCGSFGGNAVEAYLGLDHRAPVPAASPVTGWSSDVQGYLNTAYDVQAEVAQRAARYGAPRAAPAVGVAANAGSAVITAGTELAYGQSYTTTGGRVIGAGGVAAADLVVSSAGGLVVLGAKVVDAGVGATFGSEYAPKVLDVASYNAPRGVVAVGEAVYNRDLSSVDRFTYAMESGGGVGGLLVQGIDQLVTDFTVGDPGRVGTPAYDTARADAQRREEAKTRIATTKIAQENSARVAPQKFLEAFRQKFGGRTGP